MESLANGLRRYSLEGTTFTESDHNCGDIRAGLLRRFGERCSRSVRGLKTRSLVRCRLENRILSAGESSLLLFAGWLTNCGANIRWMPEKCARNEFGCIRFLQQLYAGQGWWRSQPSSCLERAAECESASSRIVTVYDLAIPRKAVEIEQQAHGLSVLQRVFPILLQNLLLLPIM